MLPGMPKGRPPGRTRLSRSLMRRRRSSMVVCCSAVVACSSAMTISRVSLLALVRSASVRALPLCRTTDPRRARSFRPKIRPLHSEQLLTYGLLALWGVGAVIDRCRKRRKHDSADGPQSLSRNEAVWIITGLLCFAAAVGYGWLPLEPFHARLAIAFAIAVFVIYVFERWREGREDSAPNGARGSAMLRQRLGHWGARLKHRLDDAQRPKLPPWPRGRIDRPAGARDSHVLGPCRHSVSRTPSHCWGRSCACRMPDALMQGGAARHSPAQAGIDRFVLLS